MSERQARVGIDRSRDRWLVARLHHESGRPVIDRLLRCDDTQLRDCDAVRAEHIILAVPDHQALVKNLRLDGGGERPRLAAFEMAQALLADESEFVFESYPAGLGNLAIGSAIRRNVLADDLIAPFRRAAGMEVSPVPMLRSIALGRGYAAFASPEGGELTALADLACDPIPLCLVHGGRPVSVGWLASGRFDLETEAGRERLAIELKTVLSFKQAALFEDGLTLPLSALLVAGTAADSAVLAALRRYFRVRVAIPQLNTGYLGEPDTADPSPGDFLTVLGLASI